MQRHDGMKMDIGHIVAKSERTALRRIASGIMRIISATIIGIRFFHHHCVLSPLAFIDTEYSTGKTCTDGTHLLVKLPQYCSFFRLAFFSV